MKLFYAQGACSLAPHIVLRETGLEFELVRVDLGAHQLADGSDYYAINPRGQVPLLQDGEGRYLSEGPVICQYIAEQAGREDLLPPVGKPARYRVLEWQNYITSELHKSFGPLFGSTYDEAVKKSFRQALRSKFEWVDRQLEGHRYTGGDQFTVADPYLFTVSNWAGNVRIDLADLDNITAFRERVADRTAVREALAAEKRST